ncbi:MAG: chloride channel protein [Candidatus Methylomirabilia bacterium]
MSSWHRLASFVPGALNRYRPSETAILTGAALAVGLGAGVGAVVFRWLINSVTHVSFSWLPEAFPGVGRANLILAPAAGGLLVGWLVYRYAREARGHGVPEVMEAVARRGGRIRPIVAVIKSLASALCIGSGGSVGREGPIVQIGSTLGSAAGQVLRLSDDQIRTLVGCGAAGGIAATFNAPIAGMFFALEVILGEYSVHNFGLVALASVTASVVGRIAFGDVPAFTVPNYAIQSLWEFPMYAGLGILAAAVAVVYTRLIYWAEDQFGRWKRMPEWLRPAVGGASLGVLAFFYGSAPGLGYDRIPHIFGVGYQTIETSLLGQLAIGTTLALMGLKIIATALTLGSGGSGGVFSPALFIGSMLGGAYGLALNGLFPGMIALAGPYAMVSMAAVFAAASHAPVTAIVILFEMTGDYRLMLPLMMTVAISTLLAHHWLAGESIYTLKLSRRGVRLFAGRVDLQRVRVEEVMTRRMHTVRADMAVEELAEQVRRTQHHGFVVLDGDRRLFGIVTIQDLNRALEADGAAPDTRVRDIATTNVVVAHPGETAATAVQRLSMRDVGRLPVVSREDPTRLLGVVRRSDVIQAYKIALTRRR